MRIAIFTDFYLEPHPLATSIKLLKKSYEDAGHTVFIMAAAQQKDAEIEKGVFIFSSANIKQYSQFRLTLSPFLSAKKMIKNLNVDIIHNFATASMGLVAATCKKDLKIPAVATITELLPYTAPFEMNETMANFLKDMATRYSKWMYGFFDAITYPTEFAKLHMKNIAKDGMTIPLPTEKGKFKKTKQQAIGYAGSIERGRDLSSISEAKEAILNKVGKELLLYSIGEKYGLLTEKIDYDQRWEAYSKLALFLEPPSYSTYPYYALEYLQSGKPAIAHINTPLAEFLKNIDEDLIYSDNITETVKKALDKETVGATPILDEINKAPAKYLALYNSMI
jgi:glycosyltransferase involved in cell wall biosynthesis